MNWLNATDYISELEVLNAAHDDRKIIPINGTNNTLLVNADLLNDSNEGGFWSDYAEWLNKLPTTSETPDLPPPDLE